LKLPSDSLKGGKDVSVRTLLGKRRLFVFGKSSAGPELKLFECGNPKDMAAELYAASIRVWLERGIVKTVKSAKEN
jgi:DNA-directed RNA polymerase subunit beta'